MSTDQELKAFKDRHTAPLWKHPTVCGVDVADDAHGRPVLTVYLRSGEAAARSGLPEAVEGRAVTYVVDPIVKHRGG